MKQKIDEESVFERERETARSQAPYCGDAELPALNHRLIDAIYSNSRIFL